MKRLAVFNWAFYFTIIFGLPTLLLAAAPSPNYEDNLLQGRIERLGLRRIPAGPALVFNLSSPLTQQIFIRKAVALSLPVHGRFCFRDKELPVETVQVGTLLVGMERSPMPDANERMLLEPLRDFIADPVLTERLEVSFETTTTAERTRLQSAYALLESNGYIMKDGKRVDSSTGVPLRLTLMIFKDDRTEMCIAVKLVENLQRIGVSADLIEKDYLDYTRAIELQRFDYRFDRVPLSPVLSRLGAFHADPAANALYRTAQSAKSDEEFFHVISALDRYLIKSYFIVPTWVRKP